MHKQKGNGSSFLILPSLHSPTLFQPLNFLKPRYWIRKQHVGTEKCLNKNFILSHNIGYSTQKLNFEQYLESPTTPYPSIISQSYSFDTNGTSIYDAMVDKYDKPSWYYFTNNVKCHDNVQA